MKQTVHYKTTIAQAEIEADAMGHRSVGTQHLLLALLSDTGGLALQVLVNAGAKIPDLDRLREEVLAITNPEAPPGALLKENGVGSLVGAALGAVIDHEMPELSGVLPLRDYFAGQALPRAAEQSDDAAIIARWAYELADAMLAERRKEQPKEKP